METFFNFVVTGGAIASGNATKIFDKLGVNSGHLAIIPRDGVLQSNFSDAKSRLKEPADIDELVKVIKGEKVVKIVIFRGGYFGMDLAMKLRDNSCDVTVISPDPWCVPTPFSTELAAGLEHLCQCKGIKVIKGVDVVGFKSEKKETIEGVKLADGHVLVADMFFMGPCAIPITSCKSKEAASMGLKMESFIKTSVTNLFLVGDLVSSKLQDLISDAGGSDEPQVAKSAGTDDTKVVSRISLDDESFLKLVEPMTHNLVLLTGEGMSLNPDTIVRYIAGMLASSTQEFECGPRVIFIVPEAGVSEILGLFGLYANKEDVSATALFEENDFYYTDVAVSTLETIDLCLVNLTEHLNALGIVRVVVVFEENIATSAARHFLYFLSIFTRVQIIFVTSVFSELLDDVMKQSRRNWEFQRPNLWMVERVAEKEDSAEEKHK